jgi:hypothetical protein
MYVHANGLLLYLTYGDWAGLLTLDLFIFVYFLGTPQLSFILVSAALRIIIILEPILRFLNLQLQRQRCSRLELFFKVE